MCTEDKAPCVVHVMDHISDLIAGKYDAVEHPVLGKAPRVTVAFDFVTITVDVVRDFRPDPSGEWWRPQLSIVITGGDVTPARFWTFIDSCSAGLADAVLRAVATCDNSPSWSADEIKDAMSKIEEFKKATVGKLIRGLGRLGVPSSRGDA